jgi:hypothetical protein
VILWDPGTASAKPVETGRLSPGPVHTAKPHAAPLRAVFPVVHTPYYYDERFYR